MSGNEKGSESDRSSGQQVPMVDETKVEVDLPAADEESDDGDSELGEKKFVKWVKIFLPHFGLFTLCAVYLLIGAAILYVIECPNELIQRDKELEGIFRLRNEFREHMWNITQDDTNKMSKEAFDLINEEYFNRLSLAMIPSIRNQLLNEKHLLNITNNEQLWTLPNSIFFATTVLTTVGYGNLMPTTTLGRVACIIFAFFGIPLMRVTINDMSKFIREFLVFLNMQRRLRRISPQRSTRHANCCGGLDDDWSWRIPVFMLLLALLAYHVIGAFLYKFMENLPYFDAFYSCFIRITTVGFGVNVPTEQMSTFLSITYLIFGLSLATLVIDEAGIVYVRKIHYFGRSMKSVVARVKHFVHPQEQMPS